MRFSLCCFFPEYISVPSKNGFRFFPFSRTFPFVSFFHVLLWFELGAVGFPGLRRMCLEAVNKEIPVSWVTSRRLTLGPHTTSALVLVTTPVLSFPIIPMNICGSFYPSWVLFSLASTPHTFPLGLWLPIYHASRTLVSLITSTSVLAAGALD